MNIDNIKYNMCDTHQYDENKVSECDKEYSKNIAKFLSKHFMHGNYPFGGVAPLPTMTKEDWSELQSRLVNIKISQKKDYEKSLWSEVGQYIRILNLPKQCRRPSINRVIEILKYKFFNKPLLQCRYTLRNFILK